MKAHLPKELKSTRYIFVLFFLSSFVNFVNVLVQRWKCKVRDKKSKAIVNKRRYCSAYFICCWIVCDEALGLHFQASRFFPSEFYIFHMIGVMKYYFYNFYLNKANKKLQFDNIKNFLVQETCCHVKSKYYFILLHIYQLQK